MLRGKIMNAMSYLREGQEVTTKVKDASDTNPNRVKCGNVFIQPTGGKGTKPLNFTYCYFGLYDKKGGYLFGFSASNVKVLEAVSAGVLPKEIGVAFKAFAEHHSTEQVVKL